MKTLTFKVDDKLDSDLDDLKRKLSKTSKAEVFRLAIAMLIVVVRERENGFKALLVKDGSPKKEFVI